MSSLLERAIVDAAALKEAALKNAENLDVFKSRVGAHLGVDHVND